MDDNWREDARMFELHEGWWREPITLEWVFEIIGKFVLGTLIAAAILVPVYIVIVAVACIGWL